MTEALVTRRPISYKRAAYLVLFLVGIGLVILGGWCLVWGFIPDQAAGISGIGVGLMIISYRLLIRPSPNNKGPAR